MSADQPISTVVETLEEATVAHEVCLRDILSEFGSASFPSVLLVVSLLLVSPLSGIPLFSSGLGAVIFLVAIQGAMGRGHIWLPERLVSLKLNTDRSDRVMDRIRRLAGWLDRGTRSRLAPLVSPPASRVLYAICAFSGLCLPMLELIPFSSTLIGLAIALISTAFLARDGLLAILGVCCLGSAALIPAFAVKALVG